MRSKQILRCSPPRRQPIPAGDASCKNHPQDASPKIASSLQAKANKPTYRRLNNKLTRAEKMRLPHCFPAQRLVCASNHPVFSPLRGTTEKPAPRRITVTPELTIFSAKLLLILITLPPSTGPQ